LVSTSVVATDLLGNLADSGG